MSSLQQQIEEQREETSQLRTLLESRLESSPREVETGPAGEILARGTDSRVDAIMLRITEVERKLGIEGKDLYRAGTGSPGQPSHRLSEDVWKGLYEYLSARGVLVDQIMVFPSTGSTITLAIHEALPAAEVQESQLKKALESVATTRSDEDRRTSRSSAGGTKDSSLITKKGEKPMEPRSHQQWTRRYGSYQSEELRALKCPSVEEFEKAIDLIYSDPDLKGLPFDSPDGMTLFTPVDAVKLLRSKGLKFRASLLLNKRDLAPERLAKMQAKYGM